MAPLNNIFRKVTRIFYSGVTAEMPFSDVQKTVMFNMAMMIGLPFILAGILINFSNGRYDLAIFNCILCIEYAIGLWINAIQKKLWIRTLIFILTSAMFIFGPLYFRNGTEYVLLITLMTAVILLDNKIFFLLFSLVIIGFVTYIRVRDINLAGLKSYAEANPYVNLFYSQFLYVIFLYAFKYLYDKYQNQLTIAYENLKTSKEAKDRILRVVAHDLRSPVGGIASLASIVLEGNEPLSGDQKKYLEMIWQTSNQSLGLINELLTNDIDDSTGLNVRQTNINQLIENVIHLLQPRAKEKMQVISAELPPSPLVGLYDGEKLMRVIQNLSFNAIKFTNTGGTISIKAFADGTLLRITIADNGIGIPVALQPHIFELFSTAQRKGTAGEPSFGIGLSVCKKIVDEHGGKMLVYSEEGKGTTFELQLPYDAT
jgi:signal transduction histidine kinase